MRKKLLKKTDGDTSKQCFSQSSSLTIKAEKKPLNFWPDFSSVSKFWKM